MNKLLANAKLRTKILVPLLLIAFIALSGAAYSGWQMKVIDDAYSQLIAQDNKALVSMIRSNRMMVQLGYNAYQTSFYDGASEQARKAAQEEKVSAEELVKLLDLAQSQQPAWETELEAFRPRFVEIIGLAEQVVQYGMVNNPEAGRSVSEEMDRKISEASEALIAYNNEKFAAVEARSEVLTSQTLKTIATTIGLILVASIAAIFAALAIASSGVTVPLNKLRDLMSKLAGGDLAIEITGVDRKDEVGQMAQTVQVFKENGIRARDLDGEATRLRETSERERAIVAREQEKVVAQLADGLSRLSDGDLAFTLNERFGEEYEKLRSDFNAAMTKLKQTMQTVSGNTHGIRGGADEISQAADDLSRRTEQQAASLEETAAALDEITATVRTTAENANEARRVVAEASESAKHSGEVVGQAVEAMSKIEKSSQQISQIIGVIDEIAFQTNLLALNAGVEAARAGDAGRGFAVVASEVRALAQRSAEAAKEIKTLISASSQQVDQGVSLVAETGTALKGIVDQVARINHLVADIAASAQEQATGLQQVNTAVNQMDQVTQQNAAMVEESTAASHSLAQETEQLSRLIGQFRTGADDRPVSAAPKRAVHKAPPQRAAQTTHTAMKTTGYGGAALKPQHQPAEDGWEEF